MKKGVIFDLNDAITSSHIGTQSNPYFKHLHTIAGQTIPISNNSQNKTSPNLHNNTTYAHLSCHVHADVMCQTIAHCVE